MRESIRYNNASDRDLENASPFPAVTEVTRSRLPSRPAKRPPRASGPKPGERRVQILQTLATMLEQPGAERMTTAALAARLEVSEAALYRHFASKAQMFEGLIEFIEQSVFTLVNQIGEREPDGTRAGAARSLTMLLQFGEKNPGMTRVMVGDALVFENERLQHAHEPVLRQHRVAAAAEPALAAEAQGSATPTVDAQARPRCSPRFAVGRLQRYARSGFRRSPTEHLDARAAPAGRLICSRRAAKRAARRRLDCPMPTKPPCCTSSPAPRRCWRASKPCCRMPLAAPDWSASIAFRYRKRGGAPACSSRCATSRRSAWPT